MISKKELEVALEAVKWKKGSLGVKYEQYPTPSDVAADVLWRAFLKGDIAGKTVADLGCGTGRLAYGAELLGGRALCVELDLELLEEAPLEERVLARVPLVPLRRVDTVLMNPPFGTKRRGADREFLSAALEIADVVYTIQPAGAAGAVAALARERGFRCEVLAGYRMLLPQLYSFHKSRKRRTEVALYRCERIKGR
ncbi:MAG: hypothetical protein GXO07_01080 [Crenarchaeota archaeon]|nr:hypothetical protein [Thermoproteota archaeon]